MKDLSNYKDLGKISVGKDGGKLFDLPKELKDQIYNFAYSLDLKEADDLRNKEEYYMWHDQELFPGFAGIVYENKVVVLCRLQAYTDQGEQLEDKIFATSIPRDNKGDIIPEEDHQC